MVLEVMVEMGEPALDPLFICDFENTLELDESIEVKEARWLSPGPSNPVAVLIYVLWLLLLRLMLGWTTLPPPLPPFDDCC